jgi:hypothetical protein
MKNSTKRTLRQFDAESISNPTNVSIKMLNERKNKEVKVEK